MIEKNRTYEIYEEVFSEYIMRFFVTEEEIDFIESIKANTELYLFSGVLRDFLLGYVDNNPRDFDFVIGDINPAVLKVLSKYLIRKNQFGGFKCQINKKEIDIWALKDTWAVRKYRPFDLYNYLPLTAFFNITAAVFSMNDNKLIIHDSFKKFLEDKKHRQLDIVLSDNPYPALCVVKTIELKQRFNLQLADRLKDYLIRYSRILSKEDLYEAQIKHYGKIRFEYEQITETIHSLYLSTRSIDKLKYVDDNMLLFDKNKIMNADTYSDTK